jgi:hypothetical protein
MTSPKISVRGTLALACAAVLAACGGGGGGDSEQATTGTLNLKITDSPVDSAAEVVVVFTGVELKPQDGAPFSLDIICPTPATDDCNNGRKYLDLLELQDGVTDDLLLNRNVQAGPYEWMRLKVRAEQNLSDGSYIKLLSGEQFPLFVPSGSETGLKLVRPFVVAQGGTTRLVVDFDVRKSVIAPPGLSPNYLLKPTLRLVDELETGTIEGTVTLAALAAEQEKEECDAGVYLFAGHDAVPDDMDGSEDDPILYRKLDADEVDPLVATYMFPFLEAGAERGKYTVAITCDFGVDASPDVSEYDPTAAEGTMKWTQTNATVGAAGETVVVDFPFPEA